MTAPVPQQSQPQPLQQPQPSAASTVGAALTRLEGVTELPLHEQPDVYQAVHTELQNALAAIDDA